MSTCPASFPPPIASNASVAPVAVTAAMSSFMNAGELELTTCLAPSTATFFPSSACAAAPEPASTTTPAPSLPTGIA